MGRLTLANITEYLQKMTKYSGKTNPVEYGDYLISISDLSDILDKYYQPDETGHYPILSEKDFGLIRNAYTACFNAQKKYENVQAEVEEDTFITERRNLMTEFSAILGKDLAAISGGIEKNVSLPELLDNSRGISLDITGQELSGAGANLSSRIPISYTDSEGNEIKGFFTENSRLDHQQEIQELFNKAVNGHPEYEKMFNYLLSDQYFVRCFGEVSGIEAYLEKPMAENGLMEVCNEFLDQAEPSPKHPEELKQFNELRAKIMKDDTFAMRFTEFAKGYALIDNKYRIVEKGAVMEKNGIVEERNAAMSVMADLIGAPDLLARSTKMKITKDGETKEGVFMQFAEGCDINSVKDDSPLNRITTESMNSPEAFDSIATLQIEDYICGNVDRHAGNMFYKFTETENGPKFTGVMGIDNDCSFGKLPPNPYCDNMCMVGTDHMLVVGEKTADKIMNLTPDMMKVTLQNYSLSEDEVNAAIHRMEDIQNKLTASKEYFRDHPDEKTKQGYIRVVKDDEWKNYTLDDLAFRPESKEAAPEDKDEYSHSNYFSTVAHLPAIVQAAKKEKEDKAKLQDDIVAKNPQMKKEKQPFKMAQGVTLTDNNAAGIKNNNSRLDVLSARMKAVNKGLFVSSKEFDAVSAALDKVRKLSGEATPGMSSQKLKHLKEAYDELAEKTKTYLDKKAKEKTEKEANGKKVSDTAKSVSLLRKN